MTGDEWSRAMRAIWLLNTIEVEMSHLGIPLMRVPSTLRGLGETLSRAGMSEQDYRLIVDELQAGMAEIESLLRGRMAGSPSERSHEATLDDVPERERSIVWQK